MINDDILYIIGFDLGKNLGICETKVNLNTLDFHILSTKNIIIDNNQWCLSINKDDIVPRCASIISFTNIINNYLSSIQYHPIVFVSEDVFVNIKMIRAYSSLLLYITKLEEIITTKFNNILYKLPPRLIKKTFSNYGNSTKDIMKNIVTKNWKKFHLSLNQISKLTEHEIDAIAVSYTFFEILKKEVLVCF